MRTTSIGLALWLVACGGESGVDAGPDTPVLDAGSDAPAIDAPAPDDAGLDAASDAPADAPADAPVGNPCVVAGGSCDPVVPGVCMDGIVGSPDRYSCGGGVGVLCCLPTSTPPFCDRVATAEEGWYAPDGTLICMTRCDGATVACEAIGTRSEGWYASTTEAGCMTPPVDRLIEWTDCAP